MYANKNKKTGMRKRATAPDSDKLSSKDSRYDAGDYEAVPASVRRAREERRAQEEAANARPAEEVIKAQEEDALIEEVPPAQDEPVTMADKYKAALDDEEDHPTFTNPEQFDFGDYEAVAASARPEAETHDPDQKVFRAKPSGTSRKIADKAEIAPGDYEAVAAGARKAVPPDEYQPAEEEPEEEYTPVKPVPSTPAPAPAEEKKPGPEPEPAPAPVYTEPEPAPAPSYSAPEPAPTPSYEPVQPASQNTRRQVANVLDVPPGDYEAVAISKNEEEAMDQVDGSYDFDAIFKDAPTLRAPAKQPEKDPEEAGWEDVKSDTPDISEDDARALAAAVAQEQLQNSPGTKFEDVIETVIAKVKERQQKEAEAKAKAEEPAVEEPEEKAETETEESTSSEETAEPQAADAAELSADTPLEDISAVIMMNLDSADSQASEEDIRKEIDPILVAKLTKGEIDLDSVQKIREDIVSEVKEMQEEEARILADMKAEEEETPLSAEEVIKMQEEEEPESEPEEEPAEEPEPEPEEEPEPEKESEAEEEPEKETEVQEEPEEEPEPEAEEEAEVQEEPEPEPEAETPEEPEPEAEPEEEPVVSEEPEVQEEPEPEPEAEEEPEVQEESEPEPESESEPEKEDKSEFSAFPDISSDDSWIGDQITFTDIFRNPFVNDEKLEEETGTEPEPETEAEPAEDTESDIEASDEEVEIDEIFADNKDSEPESSEDEPETQADEPEATDEKAEEPEEKSAESEETDAQPEEEEESDEHKKFGVNFVSEQEEVQEDAPEKDPNAEAKAKRHEDMQNAVLLAMVDDSEKTFTDTCQYIMDKEGLTPAVMMARMPIDRDIFLHMDRDSEFIPDKETCLAICFALRLSWEDSVRLLYKAGYMLSDADRYDLTIEYLLRRGVYDQGMINSVLRGSGLNGFGVLKSNPENDLPEA